MHIDFITHNIVHKFKISNIMKGMRLFMKNVIKIVLVIIATLIGAGFASGKEIYSFFFIYKFHGIFGIFISSFLISVVIYKVLIMCNKNKINTYQEFCKYVGNFEKHNQFNVNYKKIDNKFTGLFSNIVNLFLLITYYVMISGFSSFLKQEFNINPIIGSIILTTICYIIFLKNINGLIQISNYLIPILITFIIFVSTKNTNIISNFNNVFNSINLNYNIGILKCVLYACYNCIILIPVLIPIRKLVTNSKRIFYISAINFILLVVLSFSIYNLLLQGNANIFNLEMPIIEIVKKYGVLYKNIYILMIGISILTTAISAGCGFLNNCNQKRDVYKRNMTCMCISGIFLSQISFSVLVNLLYPMLGVIGLFEVLLIFVKYK